MFVSDKGSDNTVVIAIAVGVCVGLLIIAAVIIVIAVLIYRYKVKNGYIKFDEFCKIKLLCVRLQHHVIGLGTVHVGFGYRCLSRFHLAVIYHIAHFRLYKFLTAKTVVGYRKLDTGT